MTFPNTITRSLGWVACLLGAAGLPAAHAARLDTTSCALTMSNGVVVGLSNLLSGEALVRAAGQEAGLSALHRLNQSDLRGERARVVRHITRQTYFEWGGEWIQTDNAIEGHIRTRFEAEPATGDILDRKSVV